MKGTLIGLTGGIGSGKTAAADSFAGMGAVVIDSDAIAHELTRAGGAAMPAIETAFGSAVIAADGSLDRAAMRRLVFADAAQRARLESLLHPMIRAASAARCEAAWAAGTKSTPYVMMVIPLLVESGGRQDRLQRVVVVDCPEALQISRVMARSGLTEAEVKAIMATQASRAARLAVADDVVTNDGDLAALHKQVAVLHVEYCALADKIRA